VHLASAVISGASAELARALTHEGLPTGDLNAPARVFLRFGASDAAVGLGGYEMHGTDALLRSIVVLPEHRGRGIGAGIVAALSEHARRAGARHLFLMTTTARPFFERLGFAVRDRASAPPAILASPQVAELCPSSAVLMSRGVTD
jgi:N-acetylglutamate synthase-like GNAT family acetyltransferase